MVKFWWRHVDAMTCLAIIHDPAQFNEVSECCIGRWVTCKRCGHNGLQHATRKLKCLYGPVFFQANVETSGPIVHLMRKQLGGPSET